MKAIHTSEVYRQIHIAAHFEDNSKLNGYKDFVVPKLYDLLMHRKFAAIEMIEAEDHESYSRAFAAYSSYNEQICIFLGIPSNFNNDL
jgi:hypothetical protein